MLIHDRIIKILDRYCRPTCFTCSQFEHKDSRCVCCETYWELDDNIKEKIANEIEAIAALDEVKVSNDINKNVYYDDDFSFVAEYCKEK